MTALYNDNDPFVCAWLRELIADGLLPDGVVDERDIRHIQPSELATTCHFFAGIGGWPYALRLAGWPDDRPVWSASLPCPSFSTAGKRQGVEDPRHLWPAFYPLVAECRPPVIFGEQIEGAIGFGWLDGVFADLEAVGYACGATCLPAACVGAPHIRSRLFWVAYNECGRLESGGKRSAPSQTSLFASDSIADGLAESAGARHASDGMGDAAGPQRDRNSRVREGAMEPSQGQGPWSASQAIYCRDGRWRRIPLEPAFQPLASGLSTGRVGILRGAGNAIVPPVAQVFIEAVMDIL